MKAALAGGDRPCPAAGGAAIECLENNLAAPLRDIHPPTAATVILPMNRRLLWVKMKAAADWSKAVACLTVSVPGLGASAHGLGGP